jgi:hypothetical protein
MKYDLINMQIIKLFFHRREQLDENYYKAILTLHIFEWAMTFSLDIADLLKHNFAVNSIVYFIMCCFVMKTM